MAPSLPYPEPKSKEVVASMRREFESAHSDEPTEIMVEKWDAIERRITIIILFRNMNQELF